MSVCQKIFLQSTKVKTTYSNILLLYETEACYFAIRNATSIEYPISGALNKLFHTISSEILENSCLLSTAFVVPSFTTFCTSYRYYENTFL